MCAALAAKLPAGSLLLGREVTQLTKSPSGWEVKSQESGVRSQNADESAPSPYDAVIIATLAHEAARLLADSLPDLSQKLRRIPHEGTAIATFAFDESQMKQKIRGMGFVVPKIERSPILAGSFSSLKYEHRAPAGRLLIRIFAGGARMPEAAEMPEAELVPLLLSEIKKTLRIDGKPLFTTVAHWPRTMPQYHLGHRELVREIETLTEAEPTLALAGNAFHGLGIPNCIHSGFQAAERVIK